MLRAPTLPPPDEPAPSNDADDDSRGDLVYSNEGVKIFVKNTIDDLLMTIEEGKKVEIIENQPAKSVINIEKPIGQPGLVALIESANNLGTNVLRFG